MTGRFAHIVHRAARFGACLPPDAATYLLAVLDSPHWWLITVVIWVLNAWGGELFVLFTVRVLSRYFWPRLPAWLQRALLWARDYFLPCGEEARDRGRVPAQEPPGDAERISELEAKVRELESRVERLSPGDDDRL